MGIYMPDIKMPYSCRECPYDYATGCSTLTAEVMINDIDVPTDKRLDDCPLVEVNVPHGDLIDLNYFLDYIEKCCARCRKHLAYNALRCDSCTVMDKKREYAQIKVVIGREMSPYTEITFEDEE